MKREYWLEYRLTHHYTTGWAYEDDWMTVCNVRETLPKVVRVDPDDDSYTRKSIVTVSPEGLAMAKVAWKRLKRGLRREGEAVAPTFRQFMQRAISDGHASGCTCEHDCCGCWSSWARTRQLSPREYLVLTFYSQNV